MIRHNFVEAQFARVVDFKGTASGEAEVIYRRQNRLKGRLVRVVERTIDEYVFTAGGGMARVSRPERRSRMTVENRSFDRLASELALARRLLHFRQAVNVSFSDGTIAVVDDNLPRGHPLNNLTRCLYRFLLS